MDGINPAEVTKTEFATAKKIGEDYWLYVDEKAESEEASIHLVHNPANSVDFYLFDHGWLPIIK